MCAMDKTTAIALLRGARTSVKAALGVPLGDADLNVIRALLHLDAALAILPSLDISPPKRWPGDLDELREERNADHPMHAVALEMADAKVADAQTEYQTLVGN